MVVSLGIDDVEREPIQLLDSLLYEPAQRLVAVAEQPDAAERQSIGISGDGAKSDMWKRHGDDGFAHQTDSLSEPHHMNKRVARHRTLADVWTLMKRRKALNHVVVDRHPNL